MDLANALQELGRRLGIGSIELDSRGGCLLAFDDDLIVDVETAEDEPGCYLTAAVGPAPADRREVVFAELLEANLQSRGTGSGWLALDGDLDEIVLCQFIGSNHFELAALEQELESFLQTLNIWRERHGRGELGSLSAAATAGSQLQMQHENMIRG